MRVPGQDSEVGVIVLAQPPRLTRSSWLGEGTLQEQSQSVAESRILLSKKSDMNSGESVGTGSRHIGAGSRRGILTRADTPSWLEETSQEQPRPLVSRTRSQRGDIKTEGNTVAGSGHRGGSGRCSAPRLT